jgi:hypothetical protein
LAVAIALDRNVATFCRLRKAVHASDPEDSRASNSEVSRRARPACQLRAERPRSDPPLAGVPSCEEAKLRPKGGDFGRDHDVDTDGEIDGWTHLSDLDIPSANWIYGKNYAPIDPDRFHAAVSSISTMLEDFVFIDFGSGKEELFCWRPNMVSDEL